jgi:hypothetical protein
VGLPPQVRIYGYLQGGLGYALLGSPRRWLAVLWSTRSTGHLEQTITVSEPGRFHRIRHYGLLASCRTKADTLARARELIAANPPVLEQRRPQPPLVDAAGRPVEPVAHPCPCCGAAMEIIERFEAGRMPRHRPSPPPATPIRIDTS